MTRRVCRALSAFFFLLSFNSQAAAQGVQTATVRGVVRDSAAAIAPGVTVDARSVSESSHTTTVSDSTGAYTLQGLAPGQYEITFELNGFQPVSSQLRLMVGAVVSLDVELRPSTVTESVIVTAKDSALASTRHGGTTMRAADVNALPIGRTPSLVAEMAPGLTNNTPNVNQVTISGAVAYDNVFLLDGVDIGDNVLARPDDLYVEDAIDQTQVLTSNISAEFGRFSGGVVNAVTKRGGNTLSGSIRSNLTNAAWTDETPFEKANHQERASKLDRFYEGTLGGPIVSDRAWFFFSGRTQNSETPVTLAQTAAQITQQDEQYRWDAKVTASPMTNQTLQLQYMNRRQQSVRQSLPITIDPTAIDTQDTPGNLLVTNWNGVVSKKLFATAQYSRKQNHPRFGNTSTRLQDSPFLTIGRVSPGGLHFGPNYFDRTDPEDRDNSQFTGSVSYFGSKPSLGTHDIKAGVEVFSLVLRGGNSQSSTGYLFNTDYASANGVPLTEPSGRVIPVWIPGSTTVGNTLPTRGAELDLTTTSFYVQDRWIPTARLTVDAGLRFEHVTSDATDVAPISAQSIAPRLAATYSLRESGNTTLGASYAHYSGRYTSSIFGKNTPVGNAGRVTSVYNGPAGQGYDFAPAYDLSNYTVTSGSFPTANIFLDENLESPLTREFTVSATQQIGARGAARAMYVWRNATGLIESFIDNPTAAGRTTVTQNGTTFGTFDNVYYRNSDEAIRRYQGLELSTNYDRARWSAAAQWTIQLKNEGNYEGEAANQPGQAGPIGDYPEILVARDYPMGRVDDFQRHKVRAWMTYRQGLGHFGSVDVTPLWRYNSALTYSLAAASVPLSAIQRSRNPGYARLPGSGANGSQTLFFGERGSQEFAGYGLFDLAATYQVPVWKTLRPWVKLEVLNALNNDKLIKWDTTITVDPNSALDADGLPTSYIKGPRFGTGTATSNYPAPRPGMTGGRTIMAAFGLRF